jgi:hypothetical protein
MRRQVALGAAAGMGPPSLDSGPGIPLASPAAGVLRSGILGVQLTPNISAMITQTWVVIEVGNMAKTMDLTGEDTENGKEPKDIFIPWGPESAASIAHRVKVVWDSNPEYQRRQLRNPCRLCHDPEREKFDRLILMGTASLRISQEMGGRKYTGLQITNHRDRHLLPLIESEIKPSLDVLSAVPYPRDGTVPEKGWWYLSQLAGVRERALRNDQLSVAVTCLREMRQVDQEMIIGHAAGGSGKDGRGGVEQSGTSLEEALPPPEPIKRTPESIRALERSRSAGRHDREETGDDES